MTVLRTLLVSIALLAAGIGVLDGATDGFRAFTAESARRLAIRDHPPVVPLLPLQTAEGARTNFGELRGRWVLVDFIYTHCMTQCSLQGSEFARMQRELAEPIASGRIALMSVSFDPAHDDPAALHEYVRSHGGGGGGGSGAGWIAARPMSEADLAEFKRVFGVVVIPDGMGGFIHNAATLVVDPSGRLVAVLDWDDVRGAARYVTKRLNPRRHQ
jgi:protein SCO1/2